MQKLYTTSEASHATGIKESTIRSWLRRHPEVFQLDVHLVSDDHLQKLWTEAGIELLRSRAPNNATQDDAENDAEPDAVDLLEALLEHDAQLLAEQYWQLLPGRTVQRIRRMRENPTPSDRTLVQTSVQAAIASGTNHLMLPSYQPMLGGANEAD